MAALSTMEIVLAYPIQKGYSMNGLKLDARSLLQQYGQTKQLQIERLLTQYGTSLAETREMYPQLTGAIEQRRLATTFPTQELFFTPTEAAQMGLSLQEGWMLKMTPNEAQTGYGISFINPQKWEITEGGTYISPEGFEYSEADLRALLSEPTGDLETTRWVLSEEGKSLYGEYQAEGGELGVADWINLRERQQLETEEVFGAVFPEQDIDEVIAYMNEDPEGFLADIREIGPTEEMVAFLKSLEFEDKQGNVHYLNDEELQELFGAPVPEYVPESWIKDNVWDPFIAGAVAIKQGIETLLFTNPPSPPSEAVPFPWATKTTAIPPEMQFESAQSLYEYGLQNTIDGYLRRRAENDAYWASHPELTPNPEYSVSPFDNPSLLKDPGYIAYTISNSLAYTLAVMGTIVGVSAVATPIVGIPAGLLVAGMPEAGSMIDELVDMGVPIEQVRTPATLYGLAVGGIETVSDLPFIGLVFKPIGAAVKPMWNTIFKGVANRLAKSALVGLTVTQIEGLEEAVTQVVHNAILKHYDETQSILEGVSHAYIQGVIASTPFGAIGGGASYRTFRASLSQETGAKYDGLIEEFKDAGLTEQQAQVQAANELARTPEGEAELSKAIEAAQEEYWETHPELTRPSEEIIMPEMAESVLQDIEVAEEIAKKVTSEAVKPTAIAEEITAIPKAEAGIKEPWTMSASAYQAEIGVHEPWIGEISPMQYASMSERQKRAYDKKRAGEWQASSDAKAEWRRLILEAYHEGRITLETSGLHRDAKSAITLGLIKEKEVAAEQALTEALERNRITSIDQLKVGDRVHDIMTRHYATVIKKFQKSVRIKLDEGTEMTVNAGALEWQRYDDVRATIEEEIKKEKKEPAIPETPIGMPEAGLQPSMLEGVPAKEVRPEARGKLTQSRMDDYLRLREYNDKAATGRISEIKKILEKKGRLPKDLGTKGNLRLELARLEALRELEVVETVEELNHLIRQVSEELGLRSMPYAGYGGKSHIDLVRHPAHRLFKEYTSRQLEEILKVYQEARQTLSPEIPEPASVIPEAKPTEAEIQRIKTDPTPQSDEIVTSKFIEAIKDATPAREATEALKHEELQKRSAIYASILQGGEGWKAFEKAKSALRGALPIADYDIDLRKFGITDADIERMFDRIRTDESLRPFEKLNTAEALTNLMMGQIPTEGELVLLEREFGSDFVKAIMGKMPTSQKALRIGLDIANVPRTLKTFADLSATLRQGATLAVGQPVQFVEAFKKELKVVFSEKNFKLINEIIHNNVYADKAKRYGLYIAPIEEAVRIEAREEAFRGRLIERVPVIGPIVRASERAYITFLNVLRMETWAYYCKQWEGTNKSIKDYTDLASFINHATGRGDLGALSRAGSYLSAVFFSPRYVMSRLQLPLDLVKSTPAVRKIVARNLVSWVGANLLVIMLLELAGADVEKDPRSSDFGKVRFGNTRIDFWAGFQPYVRNIAQIIAEERKSTRTGEVYKFDPIDIGVNFVRSKLAPIPGLLWSLKSGKTFIGEELSPENAASIIYQELTPLAVQDWIDAVREGNKAASTIYGLLAMLGVGVQTWTNNWETAQEQLGLPVRDETLPYTIVNDIYDMKDYYSEVGRMIGGATYEMLSERDIPELVLMVARAKDAKNEISLLPSQRLTSINADPIEGDTFEQYRAQWLARQDITDEGELNKFDDLYPKAYMGNMTQNQYALLVKYHSLSPDAQAAFIAKHPELHTNPRESWLASHPEENAILALMGQSNIYSTEALSKVNSLAKSLDIPTNALVMKDLDVVTELRLKHSNLFDLLDAYGGLDDEVKDDEGLTARDRAIQGLYEDNPGFRDDMRRIEALSVGTVTNPTPEDIVESWVERGIIVDEYGAGSAEAKLWLLDNKEAHQWALGEALLTDDGTDWNEPILRLQVQYGDDFDLHEAYGDMGSDNYISDDDLRGKARHKLLFDENEDMTSFGKAYYTREASSQGYSESSWNAFVEHAGLPQWGSWRERLLLDNADFYKEYTDPNIGNHALIDESTVKPLARDKIYKQFYDQFMAWDETGGMAPKAIKNMRSELDEIEKGGMTFLEARYAVDAYDVGFPETLIDNYVEWYSDMQFQKDYNDDWWVMEHPEFEKAMYDLGIWKEKWDFSKVPTREVWNLYKEYLTKDEGQKRLDFRALHLDLDAWLVSAKGYTPVKGRGQPVEHEPSPWEEAAQVAQFKELF